MSDHANFRQRLDAVLRTLDVKQVQDFLIAEGQWSPEVPADPELAMWMMVAGSASLRNLHERARKWLVSHGHQREAEAILGRSSKRETEQGKGAQRRTGQPRKTRE